MSMEDTINWQGEPMNSPLMEHFCKHVVCRNAQSSKRLEKLRNLADEPGDYESLKETLIYLEYTDWNASEARLLRDLDRIDRAGPALDEAGYGIDNHAANPKLDRALAERGEDFDDSLKVLTINIGEQEQVFTYQNADNMDPNSQQDINDLNRWRHRVIRENVGLKKLGGPQGIDFHQSEEDYLLNRYAHQTVDNRGRWSIPDIAADFNAIFKGMYLPGRYEPCEERSRDSISSLISRKAINPRARSKAAVKLSHIKRHELAQAKIVDDWQERYAANEAAADGEGDDDPQDDGEEAGTDEDEAMDADDEESDFE